MRKKLGTEVDVSITRQPRSTVRKELVSDEKKEDATRVGEAER